MNLAIEGHSTQGSEIIARLKMLGGMNTFNLNGSETNCYYYINDNNKIYHCLGIDPRNYIYYTLEEFLEKFPYKVGDTVLYKPDNTPYFIIKMFWKNDKVLYELSDKINLEACSTSYTIIPDVDVVKLQPYKEETMEEKEPEPKAPILSNRYDYAEGKCGYVIPDGYEFDSIKQGFQTEIILRPIKPQYPKTYKECCKIMKIHSSYELELCGRATTQGEITNCVYAQNLLKKINKFQQLLICRDAYWKIAGEEMGLGKDWKPDFLNPTKETRYFLFCTGTTIENGQGLFPTNKILIFPTEEMRDSFYENFKDLIEQCKELL